MLPSLVDLTTLSSVKTWMSAYGDPSIGTSDDQNIQLAITAASRLFLRETGRGSRDWQTTDASPFNQVLTFTETYDGKGTDRLFVDQFPVMSVLSVVVNGVAIQQSNGPASYGWGIHRDRKSLYMSLGRFGRGTQNVTITYTAGFAAQTIAGELRNVPGTPGAWAAGNIGLNQVIFDGTNVQKCVKAGQTGTSAPVWQTVIGEETPDSRATWECIGPLSQYYVLNALNAPVLQDGSISYFSTGTALQAVGGAPAAGQFYIMGPGVYLFNPSDAGKQVVLGYTSAGTPSDISLGINQWVMTHLQRRKTWDLKSQIVNQAGTTSYRDWMISPEIQRVIDTYRRWH
jgi:hypothetical protein